MFLMVLMQLLIHYYYYYFQGDSGGPLLRHGNINCRTNVDDTIIGIVSGGPEGCPSPGPSQYTKVGHYLRWIVENAYWDIFFNDDLSLRFTG